MTQHIPVVRLYSVKNLARSYAVYALILGPPKLTLIKHWVSSHKSHTMKKLDVPSMYTRKTVVLNFSSGWVLAYQRGWKRLIFFLNFRFPFVYEGHLKSTFHGTITQQCVDKMLLKYTFSETGVQPLHDGLFIDKIVLGVARTAHAQNE